jgi:competence protein ComEC
MAISRKFFRVTSSDVVELVSPPKLRPGVLEMTVFDVGKGEAILLRRGALGVTVDVGAGNATENTKLGSALEQYLKREQIKLVAFVASHPHEDHLNGLSTLLHAGPQVLTKGATFFDDGVAMKPELKGTLGKALTDTGIRIEHVTTAGKRLKIGVDVTIELFVDGLNRPKPEYRSVWMSLTFRRARFLLTGDSYKAYEKALLATRWKSTITGTHVLKISHHGRPGGTSPEFAREATPRISVASTARASDHRLDASVRTRLEAFGRVYDTYTNGGDITVRTDGVWRALAGKEGVLYELQIRKPGLLKAHA